MSKYKEVTYKIHQRTIVKEKKKNVNIIKEAAFYPIPSPAVIIITVRINAPNCGHHLYLAAETKICDVQIPVNTSQTNKHSHIYLNNHC